jgi:hypothetical protein
LFVCPNTTTSSDTRNFPFCFLFCLFETIQDTRTTFTYLWGGVSQIDGDPHLSAACLHIFILLNLLTLIFLYTNYIFINKQ